jgi:hypothetical protein
MKCRSQLTIFKSSCLTVIDKLELFNLTETEEAVIFQGKYLNCGLSSRVTTVDFWQARPPQWHSHSQHAVASCYVLFRKIQVRKRSCRSYLSWRPCRGCWWLRLNKTAFKKMCFETSVKLARNPNIFQIPNHDRPNGRN